MARSIQQHIDSINRVKNADPYFSVVLTDDTSTTSVWRKQTECYATEINLFEKYVDGVKSTIEELFSRRQWGSAEWYVESVKDFQLNDVLNPETRQYDVIDASKKIITRAAFQEVEEIISGKAKNKILLKVAKGDVADLQKLTNEELKQVRGYMSKKKIVGIPLEVRSLDADLISIHGDLYYDAQLFDTEIRERVQKALNAWMLSLPFNGEILVNNIIDALQNVKDVVDVKLKSVVVTVDGVEQVTIDRSYITKAGYVKENLTNAETTPFLKTLNFIPKNL